LFITSAFAQLDDAYHGRQNTAIDFFGKVVDQDGKAIEGARVEMDFVAGEWKSVSQYPQQPLVRLHRETITTQTGTDGTFTLTNLEGHGLELKAVTKEGYNLTKHLKRFYYYSATSEPFHADPHNPIIFVLWEKSRQDQLTTKDKNYEVVPDGRPYSIDLKRRLIGEDTNGSGDLVFRLTRPASITRAGHYDWSFSIETRGANRLAPVDQDYDTMVFPPDSGYTNLYHESHLASDHAWRMAGWKQFYVKLDEGRSYAKMALIWDAVAANAGPGTNKAGIRIQYTLNPNGSVLTQ
jgi:hypothetical protein